LEKTFMKGYIPGKKVKGKAKDKMVLRGDR
jgi:hypothetical protein